MGCRSSGILTSSSLVFNGSCKLVSIHATLTGTSATTINIYDNTSGSGTELSRIILKPAPDSPAVIEFDMHGVVASNGLYCAISSGAGQGAAVSVEFS